MFTVAATYDRGEGGKADTSDAEGHIPFYSFPDVSSMMLPRGCTLVGIELVEDAIDLPSFHHPSCAAYVFGPERGSLSAEMAKLCAFIVRIPTRFSVNVGLAGAIVMYDRQLSLGRFARRPQRPGGPIDTPDKHVHGAPVIRSAMEAFRSYPPSAEDKNRR